MFQVCSYVELRLKIATRVQMALKKDAIYAMRGKYKLVAPSYRMIEADTDNEQDPTYFLPPVYQYQLQKQGSLGEPPER